MRRGSWGRGGGRALVRTAALAGGLGRERGSFWLDLELPHLLSGEERVKSCSRAARARILDLVSMSRRRVGRNAGRASADRPLPPTSPFSIELLLKL